MGRKHSISIIRKFSREIYISGYKNHQKCIVNIVIEYQNTTISIYNIHLDVWDRTGKCRLEQINKLLEKVKMDKCPNILIGGDFNAIKESDYSEEEENNDETDDYTSSADCKFDDGTYSATVDYYNPETGYSQTYTLDVEVEGCEVVQIDFPNGGWLDSDHITPAELDEDGNCTVDGEDGKTYEIQIDN